MRNKVLVVDDTEINRDMLEVILEDDYTICKAVDGRQALEIMDTYKDELAAVLLDLIMPEMDGFEVLREMNHRNLMKRIPVLVISSETSVAVEKECFEFGVTDFIRKPFDNSLVKRRVQNTVDLFIYKENLEAKVREQTETMCRQYSMLQEQAEKLQQNNINIIEVLGEVVEHRNLESGEHIKRVKGFTKVLAKQAMKDYPEYGLTPEQVDMIVAASALHDVGKIAIPDGILLKPGKLSKDEFEVMKSHTTQGGEILENISGAWDEQYGQVSYDISRYHHERYDGRGYPDGLEGEEIPISAQLVSIADVYDALVSERVYKDAFSLDQAFHMIVMGECGTFSPKLLECFRKVRPKFEALASKNRKGY